MSDKISKLELARLGVWSAGQTYHTDWWWDVVLKVQKEYEDAILEINLAKQVEDHV